MSEFEEAKIEEASVLLGIDNQDAFIEGADWAYNYLLSLPKFKKVELTQEEKIKLKYLELENQELKAENAELKTALKDFIEHDAFNECMPKLGLTNVDKGYLNSLIKQTNEGG